MPAPIPDRARVQAEILHRVAHGQTLRAVCAQSDIPAVRTVYGWTWTDPAFDQALAEALRQGRVARCHTFREDQARAFLARLAAGEPVTRLIRDPEMPNETQLARWRAMRPDFDTEVARLVTEARVRRGRATARRLRPGYRPFTEAEGDRVLVRVGRGEPLAHLHRADPTLPPPWLVRLWREEAPEFAYDLAVNLRAGRIARNRTRGRRHRDAIVERLVEALLQGESFNSLQGRDGFPTRRTLGRWARQDRAFAARIAQACEDREDGLLDLALDLLGKGAATEKALRKRVGPVLRRVGSLRTRPGVRRKRKAG